MTCRDAIPLAVAKGYSVTSDGRVINSKGRERKLFPDKDGYLQFSIRGDDGKNTTLYAHRLQAYQSFNAAMFAPGIQVRHKDGNAQNNSAENILIGTPSQNAMDKPAEVRQRVAAMANLKHDLKAVREFHSEARSYVQTMRRFNITSKGTLHQILNREIIQRN